MCEGNTLTACIAGVTTESACPSDMSCQGDHCYFK